MRQLQKSMMQFPFRELAEQTIEGQSKKLGEFGALANDLDKLVRAFNEGDLSFTEEPEFLNKGLPSMNKIWATQLTVHSEKLKLDQAKLDASQVD